MSYCKYYLTSTNFEMIVVVSLIVLVFLKDNLLVIAIKKKALFSWKLISLNHLIVCLFFVFGFM